MIGKNVVRGQFKPAASETELSALLALFRDAGAMEAALATYRQARDEANLAAKAATEAEARLAAADSAARADARAAEAEANATRDLYKRKLAALEALEHPTPAGRNP